MKAGKTGRTSRKKRSIESIQKEKDETIRMNINIPKTFYKKIKQCALDEDRTITDVVKSALSNYLKKE